MAAKITRTEMKECAQQMLMDGIAVKLGYFDYEQYGRDNNLTPEQLEEFRATMKHQADRMARFLGYQEAWVS